ncbi:MAG: IclR family transcriptional regulator [Eubacterium sp.]|jgi:IclR family KDG regulon transcriptional repressor|nr:IclR family transcriptional regulator [Lachnospiraceae bacterium]MCI9128571.1 IclR family transcriptional regulator [Eubacterium sp.]
MNEGNHRTTERILDVLEITAQNSREGLSFSDISRKLEIPKGSLSPLLSTLCNRRFLYLNKKNQKYYIGESLFSLGRCYVDNSNILNRIDDVMKQLSMEVQATCFMGVLSDGEVFYLMKKNAPVNLQVTAIPGYRLPAYCTGLGKALIAEKTIEEIKAMYPEGMKKITENTITDFQILDGQLEKVRETGFSYEREESSPYIQCIACPIKLKGKTIAAVSVAFPIMIDGRREKEKIKESLRNNALIIERIISQDSDKWIYSE